MPSSRQPTLIQPEDFRRPNKPTTSTPTFLLHDGGGTTFAYECLHMLGRYIYGIQNPFFGTGKTFAGGIPEMGYLYASWIRETASQKSFPAKRRNKDGSINILLGGWSLGGLLSLEVAKQLEDDKIVRVVGIVMIDSVYPGQALGPAPDVPINGFPTTSAEALKELEEIAPDAAMAGSAKNQMFSRQCMADAINLVRDWHIPTWAADKRPAITMLRARDYIETANGRTATLDLNREDPLLGWGDYDENMFDDIVEVDGHHFNLFDAQRIESITKTIKKSFDRLDYHYHVMVFRGRVQQQQVERDMPSSPICAVGPTFIQV